MIVLGVDPGKMGAAVALDEQRRCTDSWTAAAYTSGSQYLPKMMADVVRDSGCGLLILERQQAMPKQGATSAYTIGRGQALWEGIAAALGVPYEIVSAPTWRRVALVGIPGDGKERAILAAESRVPGLSLSPGRSAKLHDGLADACCIALYGLTLLKGVAA